MKKLLLAVCLGVVLGPAVSAAQSVFDGTWKTDPSKVRFPTKPTVLSFKGDMFECKSCVYKTLVKTDGNDQKVEGNPYIDSIAVKIIDKNTVETTSKKAGKQIGWAKRVVAADGNTMTVEYKSISETNGEVITGMTSFKRVRKDPAGTNAASGSWLPTKIDSRTDNGMTVTYKTAGDTLNMSTPTGESYSAKMDGSDAPMTGDAGVTSVAVKMIGKTVLEEVSKRDAKVIAISKTKVDASGKTATVHWENKLAKTSGSYVMVKQ